MPSVFVDTAAWIALLNVRDILHADAKQSLTSLPRHGTRLVTTEFILLEVADALAAVGIKARTITFLNKLRREPDLRIIPVDSSLLAEGWSLYGRRLDKEWGLTDCTSFVVMMREGIGEALTSDHHFEQAGFVKLLVSP